MIFYFSLIGLALLFAALADGAMLWDDSYYLYCSLNSSGACTSNGRWINLFIHTPVILADFITRFAPFRYAAQAEPELVYGNWEYSDHLLMTGVHDQPTGFNKAYFAHPEQIAPLMESAGFETFDLIGCECVVCGHEEKINALSGEAWEIWVELNYRLEKEPSLRGAADHILYIGRKAA